MDGFLLRNTDRQGRRDERGMREEEEDGEKRERCYGFW